MDGKQGTAGPGGLTSIYDQTTLEHQPPHMINLMVRLSPLRVKFAGHPIHRKGCSFWAVQIINVGSSVFLLNSQFQPYRGVLLLQLRITLNLRLKRSGHEHNTKSLQIQNPGLSPTQTWTSSAQIPLWLKTCLPN